MLKLPNWVIDIDHRPRSKSSTAQTHTAIAIPKNDQRELQRDHGGPQTALETVFGDQLWCPAFSTAGGQILIGKC
jgi:hypothetical protein